MSLFGTVKENVRKVLDVLFADAELVKDVTYRRFDSSTFSASLKRNVDTYTEYPLKAIKTSQTAHSGRGSNVQEGMTVFMLKYVDTPTGLSLKDQIVEGGEIFSPIDFDNIFDLVYSITVETSKV